MSTQDSITEPKILRVVRGYAIEWGYRYHPGEFINQLNPNHQFSFEQGCFDAYLSRNPDIALTRDLNSKTIYARTGDGTLSIESDDVGLLVTARLIDTPENRSLCFIIAVGMVRGWSHRAVPLLGGWRVREEGDVEIHEHHAAILKELTFVIHKVPRARSRKTPIFLTGGPQAKGVADA